MTTIEDHCDTIRSWLNFEYDNTLITSWTRFAEEDLSESLRCKHMIDIATATVIDQRVQLPLDWQELDFVRLVGGLPLRFRTRDEFYKNTADNTVTNGDYNVGYYTITGNFLIVGGATETTPQALEISYFQAIPPLEDTPNWVYTYYQRLLTSKTLAVAAAYSIEDERGPMWETAAQALVDKINQNYLKSRASGSKLVAPQNRSFG